MNLFLGKLICKWRGHKRGVQVRATSASIEAAVNGTRLFRCHRCGATWTRKARKAKVQP